jgi:hypothetical protein
MFAIQMLKKKNITLHLAQSQNNINKLFRYISLGL